MMLGQPATGEDFCGRTQELDDLWHYLENEHIRFPGVRRLGKTSILKRLQEQAAEQGALAQGNRAMQKKGECRTIDKTTASAAKAWSRLCKP